jgi:hypothetical protein
MTIRKKRVRLLYGNRCTLHIEAPNDFDELNDNHQHLDESLEKPESIEEEQLNVKKKKKTFKEYLIIPADSKWKSFFDIWILFLVGYSCFTSMYYVAF